MLAMKKLGATRLRTAASPTAFRSIVRATSEDDVVQAVKLAKERNLKIGVRSGGHSWAASFLRDGGMLLDLSQMASFTIDAGGRTAAVQPAWC
jgi:FAD/FMN-containing dehydrogenase